ncbi:MAG: potassium transporter Kup [Betaproteobacteria bacterium 13_1_40CM_4_64_4]|nr:MAG: potassium transporter Kup [Betaproteobacteria bacterium 13_1_40CM_4_64_4]
MLTAPPGEEDTTLTGHKPLAPLIVGAIGVVFGDIGTSPLYTLRECFTGAHGLPLTEENVYGILSVVFWAITIIVTLKYVTLIMRADNHGEGGIMALTALVSRGLSDPRARWWLVGLGIFGAAMFYGDGMITPAISVLSAVEGLDVMAPALKPFVVPVTLAILIGLFSIQRHGTASVGVLFGPVVCLWFAVLALLGAMQIARDPAVLAALNPAYAFGFLTGNPLAAFLALGAVVLAVTGTEALYADMGHFGATPIRRAWLFFVLPALVLNYFGQGALIIHDPAAIKNPFYLLAPSWALLPLVVLATCATVIASQAVISGAFSLTRQAIQMGYCPRLTITHTSDRQIGQIYVPFINWTLMCAVMLLVVGFQSSSNLAAAYGIAVTMALAIDSLLIYVVLTRLWHWNRIGALAIVIPLLVIDLLFLSSNALKIPQGGWFPIAMGLVVFTLLTTWKRGRAILLDRLAQETMPLDLFISSIAASPPFRVPGTAVFLTSTEGRVPHALLHNLKHNKVLHERVVLLTLKTRDIPVVPLAKRLRIVELDCNFRQIEAFYGFMEDQDIPALLEECGRRGVSFDMMDTSFFASRETLIASVAPGMAIWREKLFVSMSKNATKATEYFKIPTNRVVELGTQVEL